MLKCMELTEEERQELHRLHRFYWKEAKRCEESNAYLAGCIMLGSVLETTLILMVDCYCEEVEKTKKIPMHKNKPRPLLEWKLSQLLKIAKAANWLPSKLNLNDNWDTRIAKIGDYAEVLRMIRNLAHPSCYVNDHMGKRITKKYLEKQFNVMLLCIDWVLNKINISLYEQLIQIIQEKAL